MPIPSDEWFGFLWARARCLRWLRDDLGESPEQIANVTMRMVPEQVEGILRHVDAHPEEYAAEPKESKPRGLAAFCHDCRKGWHSCTCK